MGRREIEAEIEAEAERDPNAAGKDCGGADRAGDWAGDWAAMVERDSFEGAAMAYGLEADDELQVITGS